MSFLAMCDRCSEKGEITSRKFAGNIVVAVTPSPQAPMHLCESCLAELMLDALVSLDETPTARDYAETLERASQASKAFAAVERVSRECDVLKEKLAEARSESTVASRYDGWRGEKAELLSQIEALQKDRDVATAKAAQAEAKAADVVRKAAAAATQAQADDPQYAEAVAAREARRRS
jgi:hypothetical protein